jgi:prepilin-type N-terminal cleavage/methylation domain-containing protein
MRRRPGSPSYPRGRPRRGFTLVELMVAIVLITVGLLGSAALMATSQRYQRGAASREEMATLAEAKLDELRSYQAAPLITGAALRAKLAPGGSLTSSVTNYADSLAVSGTGKRYRRRWLIVASVTGTRQLFMRVQPMFTDAYAPSTLDLTTLVMMQ